MGFCGDSMPSSGGSQGAESGTEGEVGDEGPMERLREMRLKKPEPLVTLALSLSFAAVDMVGGGLQRGDKAVS